MEEVMAMAMSRNNCPASSWIKTTGKKTAIVVAVEARTAPHTSFVPSYAASKALLPVLRCRSIFSSTTMELSTSMPTANEIPAILTIFRFLPISQRKTKQPMAEMGMAMPVIIVALTLLKNIRRTQIASRLPMRILRLTRFVAVLIYGR